MELESKVKLGRFKAGLIVDFDVNILCKGIHQLIVKRREQAR